MFQLIINTMLPSLFLIVVLLFSLLLLLTKFSKKPATKPDTLPKPYPIIGHMLAFSKQTRQETFQWLAKLLNFAPTSTVIIHHPFFGKRSVYTSSPANVEHILKTKFPIYRKGTHFKSVFGDVFGDSVFTVDGDSWKSQRQVLGLEFTHKQLHKFVENALEFEVYERLIPVLSDAAKNNKVIDLQDILQRFAFDNVCALAFGTDPGYLALPLPDAKFSEAFDQSIKICHVRFYAMLPFLWKISRFLNIGSEKKLSHYVRMIREFTGSMIKSSKQKAIDNDNNNDSNSNTNSNNLLLKMLGLDNLNDKLTIDMLIAFILAGRDTSSAALTWFFWEMHRNKDVEQEIIDEINSSKKKNDDNEDVKKQGSNHSAAMEELKGMTYTHAVLCETMRLYPPVPVEFKQVATDDVLPDGTAVKKNMIVGFSIHAMGRSERIWGKDWPEFRPDRWLKEDQDLNTGKTSRSFVSKDPYSFPVFLGGPRICLGRDMAFLQMKSVVAAVLSRFKVVPVEEKAVYVAETTAKMHGGFPVRIQERF